MIILVKMEAELTGATDEIKNTYTHAPPMDCWTSKFKRTLETFRK